MWSLASPCTQITTPALLAVVVLCLSMGCVPEDDGESDVEAGRSALQAECVRDPRVGSDMITPLAACGDEGGMERTGHGRASADRLASCGSKLFFEQFPKVDGDGRTCATCHVEADGFQLTPAHVEVRYQALQARRARDPSADDPLFRSIDADDRDQDFGLLRSHALVRVTIPLAKGADGKKLVWPVDDPEATSVQVLRATPSIMNVALTAPYQFDGRAATLRDQALGALREHAEIGQEPRSRLLDEVAAFEETVFSSPSVEALSHALEEGRSPPPTDPPLSPAEAQGKALFEHHCASCHGGPTQTVAVPELAGPNLAGNIFVSKPVPPFAADLPFEASPLEPRLWAFAVPGHEPTIVPSTDPGKALLTGNLADLNSFEIMSLYGISKTAPYMHDNSAKTLEDVIKLYQLGFIAVRRVVPEEVPHPVRPDLLPDDAVAPLVAYLKRI